MKDTCFQGSECTWGRTLFYPGRMVTKSGSLAQLHGFSVWHLSEGKPQLGVWHYSSQSFRNWYCKKLRFVLDLWRTVHEVTSPCWAWLSLSPDGRSASDSCSNYGCGILAQLAEGHIQHLALFPTQEHSGLWGLGNSCQVQRLKYERTLEKDPSSDGRKLLSVVSQPGKTPVPS